MLRPLLVLALARHLVAVVTHSWVLHPLAESDRDWF